MQRQTLGRSTAAGAIYGAAAFAAGAAVGTVRVLVLTPRLGPVWATAVELPVMLAVAWWLCNGLVQHLSVPAGAAPRLVMGIVAGMTLAAAEIGLGLAAFGRTLGEQRQALATPEGALGLAGQIVFALLPLVAGRVRPRPR